MHQVRCRGRLAFAHQPGAVDFHRTAADAEGYANVLGRPALHQVGCLAWAQCKLDLPQCCQGDPVPHSNLAWECDWVWVEKVISPLSSLQTRLMVAVLSVFVFGVWIFSVWMGSAMRADQQHLLRLQQRAEVAVLAIQIDAALDIRFGALERIAADLSTRPRASIAFERALLKERPILLTLFNGGSMTVDERGIPRARWPDAGTPPSALALHDAPLSTPARGVRLAQEGGSWWLWLMVPIASDGGQARGQLVGRERLGPDNFLQGVLQRNRIAAGQIAVQQRDGMRLVLAHAGVSEVGRFDVARVEQGLAVGAADAELQQDENGNSWLVNASATESAPWTVVARTAADQAFSSVYVRQGQMLAATILLTVLAGGLIWWLIRVHLSPVRRAVTDLAMLARSPHPSTLRLSMGRKDELGVLIAGFNQALDSIDRQALALRQSEKRMADILDHVDAYVYLKDEQGRYLFANRSLCQAFGMPLSEVVGQDDSAFFSPSDSELIRGKDQWVIAHGQVHRSDDTLRLAGRDADATFLTVKIPIANECGAVTMLCGISTDITERKQLETELRIAAAAFECQEGIVVLAADLRVRRVNSAFCALTGFRQSVAIQRIEDYLRSQGRDALLWTEVWASVSRTGAWQGELRIARADGGDMVAFVTVSAVRHGNGEIGHYVVNLLDVTLAKQRELRRLEQETANRIVLVREVHHRIKNNLQGIVALLLQHARKHPEMAEALHEAVGQVQAMSALHGLKGRSSLAQMRLCELVDAIADEVALVWKRSIVVQRPLPWQPWRLAEAEAVPVALILHELTLNAVKHCANPVTVVELHVRRCESGLGLEIWLCNEGHWPHAQHQSQVQGSGLGLIDALMPRHGALLRHWQEGRQVRSMLRLQSPVVELDVEGRESI